MPESSVKELNEAKVLAVGPGALDRDGKRITPSVQAGDKVIVPQFGGSAVKVGEEEYTLFRDHEYVYVVGSNTEGDQLDCGQNTNTKQTAGEDHRVERS